MAAIAVLTPAWAHAAEDQELAQQIAANLKNSGRLKGYSISVKVQGPVVQLDGSVRNEQQLEQALAIAEVTPGIERVINNLSVKEANTQFGHEIENPWAKQSNSLSVKEAPPAASSLTLRQPRSIASADKQAVRSVMRSATAPIVRQTAAEFPLDQSASAPEYDAPPAFPGAIAQNTQRPIVRGAPRPIARTAANMTMRGQVPEMIPQGSPGADCPPGSACYAGGGAGMVGGSGGGGMVPGSVAGGPLPAYGGMAGGVSPARYDQPAMPAYAWPSYAAYPNYAALTYPKQYSPTAWPFIGPFYPYPQVPLGWRKVSLEWDNGWWMLDFKDSH
jgi:hypothetical protein